MLLFEEALGAAVAYHRTEHHDWSLAMYCGMQVPADGDAKQSSTNEDSGMNK